MLETLHAREPGRCELEDGPALPVETARRLACDCSIVEHPRGRRRASRSMSPARPAAFRRRCVALYAHAIAAACSPAAPTSATSTATTSSTGPRVVRPSCPISSRCAASITARCTRAACASSAATTAPGASSARAAKPLSRCCPIARGRCRTGRAAAPARARRPSHRRPHGRDALAGRAHGLSDCSGCVALSRARTRLAPAAPGKQPSHSANELTYQIWYRYYLSCGELRSIVG